MNTVAVDFIHQARFEGAVTPLPPWSGWALHPTSSS